MAKNLGLILAALIPMLLCGAAQALPIDASADGSEAPKIVRVWDNCGVGFHRTDWGQCVSNWAHGPGMRGCPYGYHLGYQVDACVPNYTY
jgi:hypothetical protein